MSIERGGAWRRILRRRGMDSSVIIPLASPCTLTLYAVQANATPGAVVLSVTGAVASGGGEATFTLTSSQTQALTAHRYEYRITATDPGLSDVVVLLRGYMTVYDTVQG